MGFCYDWTGRLCCYFCDKSGGVSYDARVLILRHGCGLMDLTYVFDAVYDQIKTGGPCKMKEFC